MYKIDRHPLADRDPRFNYWQVWKVTGQTITFVKKTATRQAAENYVKRHS